MLELEEAQQRLRNVIKPLEEEFLETALAANRVLARDLLAPIHLPPFDNSAMDGYAVIATDVHAASQRHPAKLQLVAKVAAGEPSAYSLEPGQCIRVFTGSPMPVGANAVVMQEDTQVSEDSDGKSILIQDSVKPWENVRLRGEDIKQGTQILSRGQKLNTASVALLQALGIASIPAHRSPVVGILATGSELIEAGQDLAPGKIFESNRTLIANLAKSTGAQPRIYPIVRDTLSETKQALELAIIQCDAVVTSGGVSVGELDYVKEAFESLGGTMDFWKVAIRPGKPFVFGRRNGTYWFGLPGNPVSALVTFLLLVRPALLQMQGSQAVDLRSVTGTLAHSIENGGDRRHFMRVRLEKNGEVRATGGQGSHMIGSLASANGLVDVPPRSQSGVGTAVRVLIWED